MSPNSWQILGKGLGNCKNLRHFACNACNLYQDDNLRKLLNGMIADVNSKARRKQKQLETLKEQGHNISHTNSRASTALLAEKSPVKEPFQYNYKPPRLNKKDAAAKQKQQAAAQEPNFGASIETLDFSDNELNDMHGLHIVSLIKSQSERRDNELWLSSLRRSVAEDHLQAKKELLNMHVTNELAESNTPREVNSSVKIKQMMANLDNAEH